jgi:hypothetical protein
MCEVCLEVGSWHFETEASYAIMLPLQLYYSLLPRAMRRGTIFIHVTFLQKRFLHFYGLV